MKETAGSSDYLQLARLVFRLSRHFTRAFDEVLLPDFGLTLKDMFVLRAVQDGVIHPGAIAERLVMPPASVSRALERLEAKGLVDRAVDAMDHRRFRLTVTDAGESVVRAMRKLLAGVLERTYDHVPPDAIHGAVETLKTLSDAIDRTPA